MLITRLVVLSMGFYSFMKWAEATIPICKWISIEAIKDTLST